MRKQAILSFHIRDTKVSLLCVWVLSPTSAGYIYQAFWGVGTDGLTVKQTKQLAESKLRWPSH